MARGLFDHIKGVTKDKVKWSSLSEEDRKNWNNFMITKWFSMEMDLVDPFNEFQKYTNGILSSSDYYTLLYDALPKRYFYLKWIGRKNKVDIDTKFIELFCKHFHFSKRRAFEYIRDIVKLDSNELIEVLQLYGTLESDIELFKKQLKSIK